MIYLEILDEKLMRKHNLIPFLPIFPFHPTENIRKPEVQNESKGNYVIVENKRISFNYARNTFIYFCKKNSTWDVWQGYKYVFEKQHHLNETFTTISDIKSIFYNILLNLKCYIKFWGCWDHSEFTLPNRSRKKGI